MDHAEANHQRARLERYDKLSKLRDKLKEQQGFLQGNVSLNTSQVKGVTSVTIARNGSGSVTVEFPPGIITDSAFRTFINGRLEEKIKDIDTQIEAL